MMKNGLRGATCVSINEVRLALELGFAPKRIILNGNGKTPAELREAITAQVIINVDSNFDFENIENAAKEVNKKTDVLIRVNPDIVREKNFENHFKTRRYGHCYNIPQNIGKIDLLYLQTNRY